MATQHADVKRLRAPFDGFVVDGFNFTKTFPGVPPLAPHARAQRPHVRLVGRLRRRHDILLGDHETTRDAGRLGASRRTHGRHQRG